MKQSTFILSIVQIPWTVFLWQMKYMFPFFLGHPAYTYPKQLLNPTSDQESSRYRQSLTSVQSRFKLMISPESFFLSAQGLSETRTLFLCYSNIFRIS